MRIISGKYRGRRILAPSNLPVRPTTDFAKEGLFNILSNHFTFNTIDVLDLFAGTGNISFEFISRYAKSVLAVDNNPLCVNFIRQTAEKYQYSYLSVIKSDYKNFILKTERKWDIIFADPPYGMKETEKIPEIVFDKKLLNPEGLFILEHDQSVDFSSLPYYFDQRNYGNVNFTFFRQPE